jgi:hypothetical protein
MKTLSTAEIEQAKLDPTAVFRRPEDVLASTLSPEDKKTILLRWQDDADERMQATDEGMPPADEDSSPAEQLRAVQKALEALKSA